uniref:Dynein regulatory complex protein 9 n=1 Tax=Otolemur garnettii TaxID=30611 RepID=H0XZE6_OTOGA
FRRVMLEGSNLPLQDEHSEIMVSVTGEPPTATEEEGIAMDTDVEIIPEITEPLSLPDVLRVSAVLEDTIDQLSILNYVMPVQYEGRLSTSLKSKEMNVEGRSLDKPPIHKTISKIPKEGSKSLVTRQGGQTATEFNKVQDLVFKQHSKQSLITIETLKKIQMDRQFFSDVIADTIKELNDSGTFTDLLAALNKERENKMHFYDIIIRSELGNREIVVCQNEIVNGKPKLVFLLQNRNEYIAHLKDQLQEMKAKTNLENQYMKKNTELQIAQTQKKCNRTEELLLEEIEKLRMKTEEENRIHGEIEVFLKKEQQKLEEKLEFWMEKFDKDTEMKQNELNTLKVAKASDLAHLQDLAKMIREYEQVIIEDRIEKEKSRKKIEQDLLELRSIIKLQAWWRGTVVRREIGGFRLPRDKDDNKDTKGKGKDKDKRRGKK